MLFSRRVKGENTLKNRYYQKPNLLVYLLAQAVSWIVSTFIFGRKMLRNEVRNADRPYVIIANHEAALDFVNLIGVTRKRLTFVISNSFYSTLPIRPFLDLMHVIPKQQFQTTVSDMKKMKAVVDNGGSLVIYPAGLMCEDGLSTPIPQSTYKFLKWLNADIYVARTTGTYFCMPKWSRKIRTGRTLLDVYQLFTREELAQTDVSVIKEKTDAALLFDAYQDQETAQLSYNDADDLEGLENVLYECPHCHSEYSIGVRNHATLFCSECGYEETGDKNTFLHNTKGIGREYRHVSDWSKLIAERLREHIRACADYSISSNSVFQTIDADKNKFVDTGSGTITLSREGFKLSGILNNEPFDELIPIHWIPTLPFKPGRYLEVQQGSRIYRCVLEDGRLVMKFIHSLKILHELNAV